MDLETRFRRIVAAFGEPVPIGVSGGRIFRPRMPIDLSAALGPGVARRLVAERVERVVDFGLSAPHAQQSASLGVLGIGRAGALLCVLVPGAAPVAVAAMSPPDEPPLVSAFLRRFMARNGGAFGVEFLAALPPWIRNRRPDLLDRWGIQRALWGWVTWAERAGATSWQTVRAHVADRWGGEDWPETLSHRDRRALLGMYLAASYIEVPRTARHPVNTDRD